MSNHFTFLDTGGYDESIPIGQHRFVVERDGRRIPGVLWRPPATSRLQPLVLLQHGGSGHKQDDSTSQVATRLVSEHGFAVAALDGPVHGERRDAAADKGVVLSEFRDYWLRGNLQRDEFVADWLRTIAALSTLTYIDNTRLGWCGVSMGTAFGLPICAECPGIRAAVFGKWSANYPNSTHLVAAAGRIDCAVLFIQHWNDEFFDREGTHRLFDALLSSDKRMHIYTGRHDGRSEEELDAYANHLARTLLSAP
jgi:dienelactone hydrolase